jgi:hypothetical protein
MSSFSAPEKYHRRSDGDQRDVGQHVTVMRHEQVVQDEPDRHRGEQDLG